MGSDELTSETAGTLLRQNSVDVGRVEEADRTFGLDGISGRSLIE